MLFIVYLIFAFDLGSKAKWPFGKLLWVLAGRLIPFAAFFVERRSAARPRRWSPSPPRSPRKPDRHGPLAAPRESAGRFAIDIY